MSLTGVYPGRTLALFTLLPEQGLTDEQTSQLVTALRDPDAPAATQAGVTLGVTGVAAINPDITIRLSDALPEYVAMVAVFAGSIVSDDPMIKQFGFALAAGVMIDALLARMALVPAVMSLLGPTLEYSTASR